MVSYPSEAWPDEALERGLPRPGEEREKLGKGEVVILIDKKSLNGYDFRKPLRSYVGLYSF